MKYEINIPETGKGVGIAVLDTGIDRNHEDLNISGGVDCASLLDGCDQEGNFTDESGHGTHVAGIIGAKDNEIGVRGIAPNANLYNVTVAYDTFPKGQVTLANAIDGLDWVYTKNYESFTTTNENLIDIVNMSWSIPGVDGPGLKESIDKLLEQDVLLVAAAGNSSCDTNYFTMTVTCLNEEELKNTENVNYPALFDDVISVGNVDWERVDPPNNKDVVSYDNLTRRIDSSVGKVDISAMGSGVCSSKSTVSGEPSIDFCNDGSNYEILSGTSQAAPAVAGILALYKERYPEASSDELKNMLYEQSMDLGDPGKDKYFGYGLANPNPPKYHPIDEPISLDTSYPIYEFANQHAPHPSNISAGNYIATKGKNWDVSKNRFEFYYIEGHGWIRLLDAENVKAKTDRYQYIMDSYVTFYDEPTTSSLSSSQSISKHKAGVILTNEAVEWDASKGMHKWFKVSIPEYNIVDKWVNLSSVDNVKPFYKRGLLDFVSGKPVNVKLVDNHSYLFDNNLASYSPAVFKPNGSIVYKLDSPVSIDRIYFKHSNPENNTSVNFTLEFEDINGIKTQHTLTKDELDKEYFDILVHKNIKSVTIKNNSAFDVKAIEIEFLGNFDKENKPVQNFPLENIVLDGYVTFYDSPDDHSISRLGNVKKQSVEILDVYGWDYISSSYTWYKVNIPELNIYNKWVKLNGSSAAVPIYKKGLFESVYNKVVKNFGVDNYHYLTDNDASSYSKTTFTPGDTLTYRFETDIHSLGSIFLKTSDLNFPLAEDNLLEISVTLKDGYTYSKIVTQNVLLDNFLLVDEIYGSPIEYVSIKNISNQTLNLHEFEIFGSVIGFTNKSASGNLKIDGFYRFYDQPRTYSLYNIKEVKQEVPYSTARHWNPSVGSYTWFLINSKELGIEDKWIEYTSGITAPLYKKGLTDKLHGKIVQHTASNPKYLFDNDLSSYSSSNLSPGQFVKYHFEKPVDINQVYLKHDIPILDSNLNFELQFIDSNGVTSTYSVTEEDLFYELFDFEANSIEYVILKNLGTVTAKPIEIEFFGTEPIATTKIVQHNLTLSNSGTFYDRPDEFSFSVYKSISPSINVTSKEAFGWNSNEGRYNWYKVDVPEYNIADKWIKVTNSQVSPVFKNGLLDKGGYTYTSANITNPVYLHDNDLASYKVAYVNAGGNIVYSFDTPFTLNGFYLKFNTTNFQQDGQLKLIFKMNDGPPIEKLIEDEEFVMEYIDYSLLGVKEVTLINTGSSAIELLEFELF